MIDFAAESVCPLLTHEARLRCGPVTLTRCRFTENPGKVLGFSQFFVGMHLGAPVTLEWREPGQDILRRKRLSRGDIHISPSDAPFLQRWDGPMHVLIIALEPGWVLRTAGSRGAVAVPLTLGVSDPTLERLAGLFDQEITDKGRRGALYIEGLAAALLAHVLSAYVLASPGPARMAGGLTPLQLRRVVDYVEAELGTELSLTGLAAVARVSPHHFAHAFKRTTGESPYRYVVGRRIHRAKELLSATGLSLAEIAVAAGFSSQSHMTFSFRKLSGATPAQYRRDARDPDPAGTTAWAQRRPAE